MSLRRRVAAALLASIVLGSGVVVGPADAAELPDFTVTAAESQFLGRGTSGDVGIDIANHSSVQATAGTLTLTFPAELSPDPTDPPSQPDLDAPTCTSSGSVLTCALTHLNTFDGQFVSFGVVVPTMLPIGSQPRITATFVPVGGDANPADNTVSVPVTIRGTADVRYSLSIPTATLTVGEPVRATATVRNLGPDAATRKVVLFGVAARPGDVTVTAPGGSVPTGRNAQAIATFSLGTVPVGATVTRSITVTARVAGKLPYTLVVNDGGGDTVDPRGQCGATACGAGRTIRLTVRAAHVGPAPTRPTAGGNVPLANTGGPTGALALTGLALLLAGAWCCAVGRRRPRLLHGAH